MRARATVEQLRSSLFFVPMVFVLSGVVLGAVMVLIDRELVASSDDLPFGFSATVDSARAVLGTVASATITVAGIAFSVSLLVIQLASSQYSPRVVHGLLRDRFSKRVMGVVVGTFTYCLVVLRSVRGPLEEGGDAVVPNVSVALAVLLGVVSILAIVAFIDHSAHAMDVSRLLGQATGQGVDTARRLWGEPVPRTPTGPLGEPPDDHLLITHPSPGWIQRIDLDAIARVAPEGGTVRLETEVGRHAVAGTPLCRVWPVPDDPDAARERAADAVVTGASRTADEDVAYAVRQLADVALRALSPGVNDPTTAQDAMFHAGTVVGELLERQPPPAVAVHHGDRIVQRPERIDHADVIDLAFEEVRLAASGSPAVAVYLLEILHLLDQRAGQDETIHAALLRQAALIRDGARRADLLPDDVRRVEDAHDARFGQAGQPGGADARG